MCKSSAKMGHIGVSAKEMIKSACRLTRRVDTLILSKIGGQISADSSGRPCGIRTHDTLIKSQCVGWAAGNVRAGLIIISRLAEGHCFKLLLKFEFKSITEDRQFLEAFYAFDYTVIVISFACLR